MTCSSPRVVVCPVLNRVRFPDRAAARAALNEARADAEDRRDRKLPRQVYGRCGFCSGFHITSQSRTQYLKWPGRTRKGQPQ